MTSLYDLLCAVEKYITYLSQRNLQFNDHGFPIFEPQMFVQDYPQLVVPFDRRDSDLVTCKKQTMLCSYCSDGRIYPRIDKLEQELPIYQQYFGVIGFDMTVTADMDAEWQNMIMLANQLFTAVLAVNGVPIAFNLRTGDKNSLQNLSSVPTGIACASGFLGCANAEYIFDSSYVQKVLAVRPSRLILYGKHDLIVEQQLTVMGIDFCVFDDYHKISKGVRKYG